MTGKLALPIGLCSLLCFAGAGIAQSGYYPYSGQFPVPPSLAGVRSAGYPFWVAQTPPYQPMSSVGYLPAPPAQAYSGYYLPVQPSPSYPVYTANPAPVMAVQSWPASMDTTRIVQAEPSVLAAPEPNYSGDPQNDSRAGWTAGAGAYLLKPYFKDNTAFVAGPPVSGTLPFSAITDTTIGTFHWDYSVSPLVWLGYTFSNGVGVRARYFYFDQFSENVAVTNGIGGAVITINEAPGLPDPRFNGGTPAAVFHSPGVLLAGGALVGGPGIDELVFRSHLHIVTLDLELTKNLSLGDWTLLFSGGGRYLESSQHYGGFLLNAAGPEISLVSFDHTFRGGGPTGAAQFHWHMGGSRLALVGTARGSLLVGSNHQLFLSFNNSPAGGTLSDRASAAPEDLVPVGEIELGLEYEIDRAGASVFLRTGVVNQTYFGLGSASRTDTNLSLFGAQLSVGSTY